MTFLILLPNGEKHHLLRAAAAGVKPALPGTQREAATAVSASAFLCSKVGKCWSHRGSIYSRHTSHHLVLFLASA